MDRRPIFRPHVLIELLEGRYLLDGAPLDIAGVQPAALDQPRIHILLRQTPDGPPLVADDGFGDTSFDIQAFLDTGSSGDLLSQETYTGLGIPIENFDGQDVFYSDTGIGGDTGFNVSADPLYGSIAPFSPVIDGTDASTFTTPTGPIRYELNPTPISDPELEDPVDIIGMPGIAGNVMVMDPKPVDQLNYMNTYLYSPGTPYSPTTADTNPGIPTTSYHVKLSSGNFDRFSLLLPPDAAGPTTTTNPIIGPDPVAQLDGSPPDSTPPVTIGMGNMTTTGSFLFDTGAAASFISQSMASKVNVFYAPGSYNTDTPLLVDGDGNPIPNQFSLDIGGTGGDINAAGFYLDSLTLQTTEGVPIRFLGAPVLVADITVQDPNTGDQLTLDGDFGMNFLVASVNIVGTDFGDSSGGPFSWVTYDSTTGMLGLEPSTGNSGTGSVIEGRQIFYNNSGFDGFSSAVNPADSAAIATDKQALLPGQTATFANYTSYTKGINGIFISIANEPDVTLISGADFQFAVGNNSDPTTWTPLAAAPTVTDLPADLQTTFTDRIELTWPDNTITNEWLQVTILANADTGLTTPDVFYFGNAPGESGNSPNDAAVNVYDVLGARGHMSTSSAEITNQWDYNRDGVVNISDVLAARGELTSGGNVLNLITAPAGAAPGETAASKVASSTATSARMTMMPSFGSLLLAPASSPIAGAISATAPAAMTAQLTLAPQISKALAIATPPDDIRMVENTSLPPITRKPGELFSNSTVTAPHLTHRGTYDPPRKLMHHAVNNATPAPKSPFADIKLRIAHALDLL